MAQVTFENAKADMQNRKKQWHKKLLKDAIAKRKERKAIEKIKTELPQGVELKVYLDILKAEIDQEENNKN